jgi:hypothetical protein
LHSLEHAETAEETKYDLLDQVMLKLGYEIYAGENLEENAIGSISICL